MPPQISLKLLVFFATLLAALGCSTPRRPVQLTPPRPPVTADEQSRNVWQLPAQIIDLLRIAPGAKVADVGAGNGYLLPWLSRAVGSEGRVYALEIQPELLTELRQRVQREGLANVVVLAASATESTLPDLVDRVVMLHSYRELTDPVTLLASLKLSLAPAGRMAVIEFLPPPDPTGQPIPLPPADRRLDPQTIEAEARGAGLVAMRRYAVLPHQYFGEFVPTEQLTPALDHAAAATAGTL